MVPVRPGPSWCGDGIGCAWAWAGPWGRWFATRAMCPTRTCVRNQAGNHLSTRHRVMRRPFGVHGSSGGPAASQSPGYFAAGPGWNLRAFRYACGCADLLWPVMKGSQASDDATGSLGPGRLQLPAMRVLVAPDCYGDSCLRWRPPRPLRPAGRGRDQAIRSSSPPNPMAVRVLLRCWAAG